MSTTTLAQTVQEATKAEEAAAKAAVAAETARQRAEAARLQAEQEREAAYREFLDVVTRDAPEKRNQALTTAGECRAALEAALRHGGDVFQEYQRWVAARVVVWEIDSELAQIRDHHGVPVRATEPPVFRFDIDISAIIDTIALELQGDAEQRITDRRTAFVNGRTA